MAGEFNATQGAQLLTTYIAKKWISALERDLQIQKFTTKVVIPPGMGKVGRVVTFTSPPGSTSAIADGGATSNLVDITTTGTNVTIQEYGEYMSIHKIQEYASSPSMRDEIVKRFTHGGMVCIDGLVNAQAMANDTNVYGFLLTQAGASTLGTPTAANAAGLIACRKKLKDAYAQGFRGIPGHPDGHFAAVIGQQAELDIVTEVSTGRTTWSAAVVNVPGRTGQEQWINGYIGSIYGIAVYTSQNVSTGFTFSGVTCTGNHVLADGAIAAMSFGDMEPSVYINEPGPNSTDNPYRNFASCAWHAYFGTKINDKTRSVKIYSAGT